MRDDQQTMTGTHDLLPKVVSRGEHRMQQVPRTELARLASQCPRPASATHAPIRQRLPIVRGAAAADVK